MNKNQRICGYGVVLTLALGVAGYVGGAANPAPTTRPAATQPADLGVGASLHGNRLFPADNPWNQDISHAQVDPDSAKLVASIGLAKPLHPDFGTKYGIPYVVVSGQQAKVPITFQYKEESDPGPYPIPLDAPIEGGADAPAASDRHVLVLDRDHWILYELYNSFPDAKTKSWRAGSGAIFNLKINHQRPAGWTSADAAGLPILPGLVRYEEIIEAKELTHAVRFTVVRSRRAYVAPATHFASRNNDPTLPPMGMRVRLKADYDLAGFPPAAQVILQGLKKYGMILADNGSDWFITGAPDKRWDDEVLNTLKRVQGKDFEVVNMGKLVTK
ncbi:MAG: hypothetical protein WCI73_18765 [Phycisphaerae bacterium]